MNCGPARVVKWKLTGRKAHECRCVCSLKACFYTDARWCRRRKDRQGSWGSGGEFLLHIVAWGSCPPWNSPSVFISTKRSWRARRGRGWAQLTLPAQNRRPARRIHGKGVGRGTPGGEERRPRDQTALPPRSLAEAHSPPAVMPGKRQQVLSRRVQSQAGGWGQLAAGDVSSVLLRESVGPWRAENPSVQGGLSVSFCSCCVMSRRELCLPSLNPAHSCRSAPPPPIPRCAAPWGPLLPRPRRGLLPQHFKGRRSVC